MVDSSIILLRTSTKSQNPKLELADCLDYNIKKGWQLSHEPFEKQESAYKNPDVWKDELQWAIDNDIKHIIVWNMDRFSRQPENDVLALVKMLSLVHGIQIHAVHGDTWSELVESIGKLKELGFIGDALSDFLEKVLKGLEFQRAHRESQVKGERVKAAVRKEAGKETKSYKGNRWGRKKLPDWTIAKIRELDAQGLSIRQIIAHPDVYYYDKNNNRKKVGRGTVHKSISGTHPLKQS